MAATLGALVVLSIGLWDQTSPLLVPNYPALSAAYRADQLGVEQIEAATSPTAMILQLPYHPFPEYASAQGVGDSNQLRFYLHSHTLRWSGGGIKGRPASDWVAAVERLPTTDVIVAAVSAGFSGIFIDTRDLSPSGTVLAAGLERELGPPVVTGAESRYVFYSLETAATSLHATSSPGVLDRIGAIAVSPVVAQFLPRFDSYTGPQLLEPYNPRISLDNDRAETVTVRLRFVLGYSEGSASITARMPDGTVTTLEAVPQGTPQELLVEVPPGTSAVTLAVADGPPISRHRWTAGPLVASSLEVTDVELARLLSEARVP